MEYQNEPRIPLLQDINHYLESNGVLLHAQEAHPYEQLDQAELKADITAQKKHQSLIIGSMIKEDEAIQLKSQQNAIRRKDQVLEESRGIFISISTLCMLSQTRSSANEMNQPEDEEKKVAKHLINNVPLFDLVNRCDMFLTLVSSDHWSSLVKTGKGNEYVFSMEQFDAEAVKCFLSLIPETATIESIPNHHIIECCYIAHYLQAKDILNEIVEIIQASIDSDNCTSICILAEELQIPSLLQSSMRFVMEKLEDIQQNEELWNDIPSSLRNHIITLRNAAHSSIIGAGHLNKGKIIFSSGNEFIAIFHDTLTMNKERLHEAKERQNEIINERKREADNIVGRFSRRFVQEKDIYGGSVKDASIKIKKQEERVKTLQAFYNEQKAIFAKDAQSCDARFRGSFHL